MRSYSTKHNKAAESRKTHPESTTRAEHNVVGMEYWKTQPSPMQEIAPHSHDEGVEATVDYLVPGSRINRRYVAPGAELNTGRYAPHTIFIRNGRPVQGALGL